MVTQRTKKNRINRTSREVSGDLTCNLTVFSRDFAVKTRFDFRAKRRPVSRPNFQQIRRISEQLIKGHNKTHANNNSYVRWLKKSASHSEKSANYCSDMHPFSTEKLNINIAKTSKFLRGVGWFSHFEW